MPEFPYMPLYVDDYLSATHELSTLEHGAYLLLLFAAWKRPGCDLPDDDVKLARVVKQPLGVWTKRLRAVLEPFFEVADGLWRQKRQGKIRAHVAEVSEKRRQAAKAGHEARASGPPAGRSGGGSAAKPLNGQEPHPAKAGALAPILKSSNVRDREDTSSSGVPPSRTRAHEAAAAMPAASRIPLEVDFLERVEAGGGDPFAAGQVLAAWKAEFAGDGYAAVLRATLASARSNPLALAELKFGDLRKDRHRGEAEARRQQTSEWSADALIAAAARRQVAERDEADAWPTVTECPRLGGPE